MNVQIKLKLMLQQNQQIDEADVLKLVHRIMSSYGGRGAIQDLINLFETGISGEEIAKRFSVSRQRVSQWKKILGSNTCQFHLHPKVAEVIFGMG